VDAIRKTGKREEMSASCWSEALLGGPERFGPATKLRLDGEQGHGGRAPLAAHWPSTAISQSRRTARRGSDAWVHLIAGPWSSAGALARSMRVPPPRMTHAGLGRRVAIVDDENKKPEPVTDAKDGERTVAGATDGHLY
jgi:hypothetical protein